MISDDQSARIINQKINTAVDIDKGEKSIYLWGWSWRGNCL